MSFNTQTKQVETSRSKIRCAQSAKKYQLYTPPSDLNLAPAQLPLSVADANSKPFLTRRELAQRLQIGISTLAERYNKNSVRYDPNFPVPVKLSALGRKVVFSTVDVNAWCNAVVNRSSSNSQVRGVK